MDATTKGQVTHSAAEAYEELFLPALFSQWTGPVSSAAGIALGERVLDLACGTGVLAREVLERVGPTGQVVGLDCNEGMLEVARRAAPRVDWRLGQAESLPFDDGAFDAVVSQFGLMFFEDRVAALGEAWRVLRPGGRLAVAVWDGLERSPGYGAMVDLLQRLFGAQVAEGLRSPFALGAPEDLRALFAAAGISKVSLRSLDGLARYPSIESWVHTDVTAWTISEMIDEAQVRKLQAEAQRAFKDFEQDDGSVVFSAPAHIVSVAKG